MVTRTGSRPASPLSLENVEFTDADEGCHLRWSPSRSVTMRWVWLSAVSFIGAAPRWRLSWVVQALSTLSEPLGAAATI